jgi:hypothetical protein
MPFSGMDVLAATIRRARDAASGRTQAALVKAVRARALTLAQQSFAAREAPSGRPWRAGRNGIVPSLVRTGALKGAIKTQGRPRGFAIIDVVSNAKGARYAGSQIYGRTYHVYAHRLGGARLKLRQTWRLPARPFVPRRSEVPPAWEREFKAAADAVLK